ncbi:MAG: dihydrodipicolinate synthase family protein [Brevinema sp.]
MSSLNKYRGVFPALYACYDDHGAISTERFTQLIEYYIARGIKGLYVGGSSGECIYHTIEERKMVFKAVAEASKGRLVLIAHIGAPNTRDSVILAKYAEEYKYDALSSIPPIYFPLSDASVEAYWTEMATATNLDFFIYNIPQLTNYNLSVQVYQNMLKLPQVVGVKNSSMPVLDIMTKKMYATKDVIVFNGPDEQYIGGRIMGADGGIGGTYGVMPELYLTLEELYSKGQLQKAQELQMDLNVIITKLCGFSGHMYSVIKEILKLRGLNVGTGRPPLKSVDSQDKDRVKEVAQYIDQVMKKYSS